MSNLTGRIKSFDYKKGFGYIKRDNGKKDLFVHIKSIKSGILQSGSKVIYEVISDENGKEAAWEVEVI